MNSNEYSKMQNVINELLKNDSKQKSATEEDVINMINKMDKNEMTAKLNSMGLSFISDKIQNTSKEELISMLKSNPQLVNKLNSYLK